MQHLHSYSPHFNKWTLQNLRNLVLQNNRSPLSDICLKKKEDLTFEPFAISEVFQKLYSNLGSNLVNKLLAAGIKFDLHSVEVYYKNILQLQENKFTFQTFESSSVLKLLVNVEVSKAADMDNMYGRFLKDGYISHLSNSNLQFIY